MFRNTESLSLRNQFAVNSLLVCPDKKQATGASTQNQVSGTRLSFSLTCCKIACDISCTKLWWTENKTKITLMHKTSHGRNRENCDYVWSLRGQQLSLIWVCIGTNVKQRVCSRLQSVLTDYLLYEPAVTGNVSNNSVNCELSMWVILLPLAQRLFSSQTAHHFLAAEVPRCYPIKSTVGERLNMFFEFLLVFWSVKNPALRLCWEWQMSATGNGTKCWKKSSFLNLNFLSQP